MDNLKNEIGKRAHLFAWALLVLVVAVALFVVALFVGEFKSIKYIGQNIEFRNTITVSGKGEVMVVPDISEFNFGVIAEGKTAAVAQEEVTKKMNAIIAFLKKKNVNEKDIKTTNYSINPRYEYEKGTVSRDYYYPLPNGKRNLAGYEVSHWVTVKLRTLDDVGAIVAEVGTLGATNVSGVNFVIDDEEKILAEARGRAIADARIKAKELARDLGVHLVKVVSFSDGGYPIYYRALEAKVADGGMGGGAPSVPEIPIGENTVTSNVTITYAIR